MMLDFDELLPDVLTHANKCPEPVAVRFLREAAREFCKLTRIWKLNDTIPVSAPDFEGICTAQDAIIVAIEEARMNDRTLLPVTLRQLDELRPGWAADTDEADPRYITQLQPSSVTIYPRQTGTIAARLIMQPSRRAIQLPDFLVENHGTTIASGALAKILMIPETEYASPQLAGVHQGEFEKNTRAAGREVARTQTGAPLRTTPGYF